MKCEMKFLGIIICTVIASVFCQDYDYAIDPTQDCQDVSILAMGLSGSGIFSTVQKLMSDQIQKNESTIPSVTEYSWQVALNDGKNCRIRIAVSPGQIEGRDSIHDARTLATIKEYIQSPSGLQGISPSIVLVVSRFDDISADSPHSKFVRLLKNVESLEPLLGYSDGHSSNIIFHFNHVMSRNRKYASNPGPAIQGFKNVIKKHSRLPDPTYVTLGENRPDHYKLPRRGAYIRLPNNDLYPKNIIDTILRILQARNDNIGHDIVQETFKDPYRLFSPQIQTFIVQDEPEDAQEPTFSDEVTTYPNLVLTTTTTTESNVGTISEIDEDLQAAYDDLDEFVKMNSPIILQLVRNVFKRENITRRSQLPKTKLETTALFQKLPFHTTVLALIQEAFELRQPPFIHPTVVGYGYDILRDQTVETSPFILTNLQPTPIGYSLPDIYMCTKENETFIETFKLVESYEQYQGVRLKDMGIEVLSYNTSAFIGAVRSGYNNIKPDEDGFVSITAIRQIRDFKLDLILSSELDENFISDVNGLTPFNQHDRESEKEWNAFFRKYGTHVITEAFGGGYMEGKASGSAIQNNLNNQMTLYDIKDTLISFDDLPTNINRRDIHMSNSFVGGSPDEKMEFMNDLPENERDKLFKEWRNSVRSDPRIMVINIRLTPLSEIASSVNETISQEIENSLNKLLQGNLIYQRRRNKPNSDRANRNRTTTTTTTTPKPITTTEPPKYYEQPNPSSNRYDPNYGNVTPKPTICPPPVACPSKNETCSNVKNNKPQKEYSKNFIGQGYHILKDKVLSNSPFGIDLKLKKVRRVSVPNGVDVTEISSPCVFFLFKKYSSFSEYATNRINSMYTIGTPLDLDLNQFEGSIKPGYNINIDEDNENEPLSVYQERRYFDVAADFSKFSLSPEFIKDVNQLQSYNTHFMNCTVREQWQDFFSKYGTHVVKAGYAGVWTESRESGRNVRMIESKIGPANLEKCKTIGYFDHESSTSYHPTFAIHSATFETMKNALRHFYTQVPYLMSAEYDIVLVALLENRLKRCDES